jgi:hypothetical protein
MHAPVAAADKRIQAGIETRSRPTDIAPHVPAFKPGAGQLEVGPASAGPQTPLAKPAGTIRIARHDAVRLKMWLMEDHPSTA